ncbi:hypothetical protein [Candidatus Methanodesulfokora washburnensis]|nr:hypothetical protein [Candidatus Methanodesulfokores washburnensis]
MERQILAVIMCALLLSSIVQPVFGSKSEKATSLDQNSLLDQKEGQEDNQKEIEELLREFEEVFYKEANLTSVIDEAIVVGFLTKGIEELRDHLLGYELNPGIKNSLVMKLNNALEKAKDASRFVLEGRKNQADNMINASANILSSFINEVEALKGKKIPEEAAEQLIKLAEDLIEGSRLRGYPVVKIIQYSDLSLADSLRLEIEGIHEKLREVIDELREKGVQIEVKIVSGSPGHIMIILYYGAFMVLLYPIAEWIAYHLTEEVDYLLKREGKVLTSTDRQRLYYVNLLIIELILTVTVPKAVEEIMPIIIMERLGLVPIGTATPYLILKLYQDEAIRKLLEETLALSEKELLSIILRWLGGTVVVILVYKGVTYKDPWARYAGATIDIPIDTQFWITQPWSVMGVVAGSFCFIKALEVTKGVHTTWLGISSIPGLEWSGWIYANGSLIGRSDAINRYNPLSATFNTSMLGPSHSLARIYAVPSNVTAQAGSSVSVLIVAEWSEQPGNMSIEVGYPVEIGNHTISYSVKLVNQSYNTVFYNVTFNLPSDLPHGNYKLLIVGLDTRDMSAQICYLTVVCSG